MLVCCMRIMSWVNVGYWKLIPGPFMILLKQQYSKIWSIFIVDIYNLHMTFTYLHFQKKKKKKKKKKWNTRIMT